MKTTEKQTNQEKKFSRQQTIQNLNETIKNAVGRKARKEAKNKKLRYLGIKRK